MRNKVITIAGLLFTTITLFAQEKTIPLTTGYAQKIQSAALNETRTIYVQAPETITQPLPLIIVLDGETLFQPVSSAVQFMTRASEIPQMPEAIVVGIPNTERQRDMPPPQQFGSGGEEKFRQFIREELIPALHKKYKTNGHTVCIGHSQGGLFVSYLLTTEPKKFPWVIALDAPMTVQAKTNNIKNTFAKLSGDTALRLRYLSAETLYGWREEWSKNFSDPERFAQIKLPDETHESMPFKAIYDGLRFLYKDFAPLAKDMTLPALQQHYATLSKKYGYTYEVPLKVLLASAGRKVQENRKGEAVALLSFAEKLYGKTERTAQMQATAAKLTDAADVADRYLNLPKPTAQQIKPYLGRWVGELVVPRGQNVPVHLEIVTENGKVKLLSALPWDTQKKEEAAILSISDDGKLIFGRKNGGGGWMISTATLDKDGNLSGEEQWVGFSIPQNEPEDVKAHLKFILENPNRFVLKRKG